MAARAAGIIALDLAKGLASVSMEGRMVDTPVYISAQNVLEMYRRIQEKERNF